jgi:hypothetical protein
MAASREPKYRNGYHLPVDKLEQREAAFAIYRDLGPRRSLVALERELKCNHPEIAVSRQSLEKWSKTHHWVERVRMHDNSLSSAPLQQPELKIDPNFDQVDALLQAANRALTRAMSATPVVTKPSDVKALVDAAANALKLVETIRSQSVGKVSREEIAKEMARVLDLVRQARNQDVELLVEAELKKHGIARSGVEQDFESAAPMIAVDHDKVDLTDGEPATAVPVVQESKTDGPGLRKFVDVLTELRGGQNDGPQILTGSVGVGA